MVQISQTCFFFFFFLGDKMRTCGPDFTNIDLITPKFVFLCHHIQLPEDLFIKYINHFYNINL